jgi:DNA-binding response OmpR family regulator
MGLTEKDNFMESNSAITGVKIEQTTAVQGTASGEINTKSRENTKKILLIEDTEDLIKLVKMYLEHHRYEVITAYDGQEGLQKAKTDRPDLIILDLMLPKINGYKVCGLLKRDTKYSKIPIILFTAKTQEKDMKLGKEVGADAYLTKPFEPEVLLSKIRELIKE